MFENNNSSSSINHKASPNQSPVNDHIETLRRSSVVSETNGNWGSFGGFQWEGPSIFDEDGKPVNAPSTTQTAPDVVVDHLLQNTNHDILSVPMLPNVSIEPIYRQHRSLSFSMGQDPTFFGYDDYEDTPTPPPTSQQYHAFKSSLAPMEEEDDVYYDETDLAHIRSRSKSSGAAFGLLSQTQYSRLMNNGHIRRGSEQQDDLLINQRRRSSSRFFNLSNNEPQMSLGDKERLRRLSTQQNQFQEYSFPEAPATNYNLMRRQSLTLNTQPPANIQQLADQLENTHLRPDFPAFQQQQQQHYHPHPPQFRPSTNDLYTQHLQQQPLFNNYPYHQLQSPHQQVADDYFDGESKGFQDLGKGIPVSRLDPKVSLYMVEFKGGRTDFFYIPESSQFQPQLGDLVIVEGDRGKDLGKVAANTLSIEQVTVLEQKKQAQLQRLENKEEDDSSATKTQQRELHIKRIFRLAAPDEINMLLVKGQDEHKALVVCQQKTKQRKLPMEVVDAEYQWDRRKLTFFFEAENRIDFRELVRELFKIYKTRIWM